MKKEGNGIDRRNLLKTGIAVTAGGIATTSIADTAFAQNTTLPTVFSGGGKQLQNLPTSDGLNSSEELMLQLNEVLPFEASEEGEIQAVNQSIKVENLPENLPDITRPIDAGSEKLLAPYLNSRLSYPPLQIEYLVETLSEHINTCLEIREKAQELEVQAISARLELITNIAWHNLSKEQASLNKVHAHRILGNKVDPKYDSNTSEIVGKGPGDRYFKKQGEIDDSTSNVLQEDINRRKTYYGTNGSGINYSQRFDFLKSLFENELVEAYQRALSISAGLYYTYGLKYEVPKVKDVGYLSELAIWTRKITYALEQVLLKRTKSTISLSLRHKGNTISPAIMDDTAFSTQRAARRFVFTLDEAIFKHETIDLKEPLLRGVSLAVENNRTVETLHNIQPIRFKVSIEEQEILDTNNQEVFDHKPVVRLPMVSRVNSTEVGFNSQRELHNVNPIGKWEIEIDTYSLLGNKIAENDSEIGNIILFLHLAHEM